MTTTEKFAKRVVIYSVGLLGGSLGLALKRSGFTGEIIGLSADRNIETAKHLGCIDTGHSYEELQSVIRQADILFLCSPILTVLDTIRTLGSLDLPNGLIITDVGSTKTRVAHMARQTLPAHVHFVGGHPMAGSEKSGPSASDPYLFQNAIYVLSPLTEEPDETDKAFAAFLERYLGCRHVFLDPKIHDHIAATVSHLPHLLAVALVNLAREAEVNTPGTMQLAAGGFRDLTRIASAPYRMWHDILATNRDVLDERLCDYIARLNEIRQDLRQGKLAARFDSAAETRRLIPRDSKGFISQLHEILVVAKDQPGVISAISNALAEHRINIKDIEVLKVREGEGGTIRLAFDSSSVAQNAAEILTTRGFTARERK